MQFKTFTSQSFLNSNYFEKLPIEEQQLFKVLTKIFHFKVNNYVLEHLIDWDNIPEDPMYRLTFPRKEMLNPVNFEQLNKVVQSGDTPELIAFVNQLKKKMFPHINYHENCLPIVDNKLVKGIYHLFKNTLALFPSPTLRTCHSYCTYCFRWVAFNDTEMQNDSSYDDPLVPIDYIKQEKDITDVVLSGADPMVLPAKILQKYIEPLLDIEHLQVITINTKALAWWPYRFTEDKNAQELLELCKYIRSRGKHLNILAHFTHPRELEHPEVKKAADNILATGTVIRCQAPVVRGINDSAAVWAELWTRQVQLGMVPFYMLMELDHNQESGFHIPPSEALSIFKEAQSLTSGMAKTVHGPCFINDILRVSIEGQIELNNETHFVLKCLQAPKGIDLEGNVKLISEKSNLKSLLKGFETKEENLSITV